MNAPFVSPIKELLDDLHARLIDRRDGEVATYIPELGKADPEWFGLAVATLDGTLYEAGDTDVPFTIQSVSKPFVYALALQDRGLEDVLKGVGVEPTGDAFNAVRLEPVSGRPYNPMVNSGAIVTSTLVGGADQAERRERILSGLSAFAGRELEVDRKVLTSESATGDRNRALAYLMHGAGVLTCPVEEALELYFEQCAALVTTRDLAVMTATLAGGGVNPLTGETVVSVEAAANALTVMATCGTYDYAGEWLVRAGLPAKSGVSGGLIAALPSQLGLGAFSPRLDARGNSVRAVAACEELSSRFGLHLMRPSERSGPVFHRTLRGDTAHSSRVRAHDERTALARLGGAIRVYVLRGDLAFGSAEAVVRTISEDTESVRWVVLDLKRAGRVAPVAVTLLEGLAAKLKERGITTVIVDTEKRVTVPSATIAETRDEAMELCEDALLAEAGAARPEVPIAEQDLLRGLDPFMVTALDAYLETREYETGERLVQDVAALCFILSGGLARQVIIGDRAVRETSMGPGTAVGRLALIDDAGHSHRIVAEGPTSCKVLTTQSLARLERDSPRLADALRWSIANAIAERLRRTDAENHALIH
ncbi:glutaminase A [Actinocorallia sp. A-T 12471]|uniref:glutaminase A n=1 Tax=Actinocorallia sp. A-T 12471 TaxID=3089813 RepID=UPI0029CC4D58|nr:glutaminase A [Actinocorallia sp. A-T 12471]MDX6740016.1 glutaminase A [Actinocorallia sp. A-T 12471]